MPCFGSLDEAGYYCVEGMAVMMAQARSLGFNINVGTQDIPSLMRIVEKEAKSMIANATTFVWMRVAETEETGGLAVKQAGEATFAQMAGYAAKAGEFTTPYLDNMEARFEKQSRITVRALRALEPGDAYVTFRDTVLKVKMFFANPEGEYGDTLDALQLQVNHFLKFDKPTTEEIKKTGVLVDLAERLADSNVARVVEQRAREARAVIAKLAAEKKDPTRLRSEIAAGSVAFLRAAYGGGKKASAIDLITAGAASIAAILKAMQKQGDAFAHAVRTLEGLDPRGPAPRQLDPLARSGRDRAGSEVPGLVTPAALPAAATPARPAAFDALRAKAPARRLEAIGDGAAPPDAFLDDVDDIPPENDDDEARYPTAQLAAALDQLGSPEARREAAVSSAPSRMKEVTHGASVDDVVFDMARKMQSNAAALQFLSALDFGGEPGADAVDAALEEAATGGAGDLAPPPRPRPAPVTAADLERADVASARAAQWVDRGPPDPARPTDPEAYDKALEQGDVIGMTQAFLAELLERE
jgi:type IV secretory system conjugative DNA transfer VirD4/TraG family protein